MDEIQVSVSLFNGFWCLPYSETDGMRRERPRTLRPNKLRWNCTNNEALMDEWSASPNSCLVMISFAHLKLLNWVNIWGVFFSFNRTHFLLLFSVFFLVKTWCHIFQTPLHQSQMTSVELIYQTSAAPQGATECFIQLNFTLAAHSCHSKCSCTHKGSAVEKSLLKLLEVTIKLLNFLCLMF